MKALLASVSGLFSPTDEQAMWRVHTHDDPHAFALLMRRWEVPIQRLCTRMLGDQHRGQDLTQDAFARLYAKRKDYEPTGRFSTFLWRVALNLCYDELRRIKRRPESHLPHEDFDGEEDLPMFATVEPAPDAQVLRDEESAMVRQAVLRLSEACRSVVILRHYEGLKFREIAEVLGIPEGTVKSRMAEALSQLEKQLAKEFQMSRSSVLCKPRKSIRPSLVL